MRKSEKVDENKIDKDLIDEMLGILNATNALGISAPQLGELVQIIGINTPQITDDSSKPLIIVNPIIKRHPYKPRRNMREGCLSIPGFFERVRRYEWIEWEYLDYETGIIVNTTSQQLMSAAVQHEIDHLNGILFIDRIGLEERALFDGNWEKTIQLIQRDIENEKM